MAIYVYEKATGKLYSWCPNDDDQVASDEILEEKGFAKKVGLAPLDDTHGWNESTTSVDEVIAPVVPKIVGTGVFILRFTPAEFGAITNSQNAAVQQWVFALNHTIQIDLNSDEVRNGIGYLAQLGLLTSDRVTAVLE